jgi:hypothetical protein
MLLLFLFTFLLGLAVAPAPNADPALDILDEYLGIVATTGSGDQDVPGNLVGPRIEVVVAHPNNWDDRPPVPQAVGDRRARLRCAGKFPSFSIPAAYSGLGYTSLVELCAKISYGGNPFSNVGGYCGWFLPEPRVVFDPTLSGVLWHSKNYAAARRMALYCQTKCACALDLVPEAHLNFKILEYNTPSTMWALDWDNHGEWRVAYRPSTSNRPIISLLFFQESLLQNNLFITIGQVLLTGYSDNAIACHQRPIDTRYLPRPVIAIPYPSILSLCAASIIGGSLRGNAGGICLRTHSPSGRRTINFPDEFTYPDFDMDSVTMPYALTTALWCTHNCWCDAITNQRQRRPSGTVEWLYDATVDFSQGGCSWTAHSTLPTEYSQTTYVLLPKEGQSGSSGSGSCASGSEAEQCTNGWPNNLPLPAQPAIPDFKTQILLPLPQSIPATPILNSIPSPPELAVCGTSCSSNQECLSNGGSDCRCVVNPDMAMIRAAGLDPVAPGRSRCFSWALQLGSLIGRSVQSSGEGGGGRGKKRVEDYGLLCACNQTYVSPACCASGEGLVWESGGTRGQLRMVEVDLDLDEEDIARPRGDGDDV